MKLAIEIGGNVIRLDHYHRLLPKDQEPPGGYLSTKAISGAWDGITWLTRLLGDNFVLVATNMNCYDRESQLRVSTWLENHRIFDRTGLKRGNVHFLLGGELGFERHGGDLCHRLKVTHFIGHTAQSLEGLTNVPNLYLLNPLQSELDKADKNMSGRVQKINNWLDVVDMFEPLILND